MPHRPRQLPLPGRGLLRGLDREYYLHFAGPQAEFEVEPIYERHRDLFDREAVEPLRELAAGGAGEARRRAAYLLEFAVGGLHRSRHAPRRRDSPSGRRRSRSRWAGERIPYRVAPVVQANEADRLGARRSRTPGRRSSTEQLNPLYRRSLERRTSSRASSGGPAIGTCTPSCAASTSTRSPRRREPFLDATAAVSGGLGSGAGGVLGCRPRSLRRSDLPRFFRAPELDAAFPAERLIAAFEDASRARDRPRGAANVHLDTEQRPTKSPRAFCAPARVPDEVYLVVPPVGGRDDYAALFHEAATPSTTPTPTPGCRSSSATSATTRSPSRSPS